jgi:hypothetical protein
MIKTVLIGHLAVAATFALLAACEPDLVCERTQVAGPTATGVASPFGPQCRNIEWHYKAATTAIRQDLEARIAVADYATIAQGGTPHP